MPQEARLVQVERSLLLRVVEGGVIVCPHRGPQAITLELETAFTSPERFAQYMRAWFVANHGEEPTIQLPRGRGEG